MQRDSPHRHWISTWLSVAGASVTLGNPCDQVHVQARDRGRQRVAVPLGHRRGGPVQWADQGAAGFGVPEAYI